MSDRPESAREHAARTRHPSAEEADGSWRCVQGCAGAPWYDEQSHRDYVSRLWAEDWNSLEDQAYDG